MNYHSLEVSELNQEAKQRRIKLYYVMKRAQLIELLCMPILPEKYIVEKKTIVTLRTEAKLRGFPCIYKMNRQALLEVLYPHLYGKPCSQEYNKNHNCAEKHDDPKSHDSK